MTGEGGNGPASGLCLRARKACGDHEKTGNRQQTRNKNVFGGNGGVGFRGEGTKEEQW